MPNVLIRKTFVFLRHGETDWNRRKLCVGQIDRPLTDIGREQARSAKTPLLSFGIGIVFHSPLSRARETARLLAYEAPIKCLEVPGLVEANLGIRQGLSEANPDDDFVTAWLSGGEISDAENFGAFQARIVTAVNDCLLRAEDLLPLIVAHAGVYAALTHAMGLGIGADIAHCLPCVFRPQALEWVASDRLD